MYGAIQTFENRLTARRASKPAGFDPITIITIIMALFESCPKPTMSNLRRRPLLRARLAAFTRRETGASYDDCFDCADDVLAISDEATTEEKQRFIDECCGDDRYGMEAQQENLNPPTP